MTTRDRQRVEEIEALISWLGDEDSPDDKALEELEVLKCEILRNTGDRSLVRDQWLKFESEYYLLAALSRQDLKEHELLEVVDAAENWYTDGEAYEPSIVKSMALSPGFTESVREALRSIDPRLV